MAKKKKGNMKNIQPGATVQFLNYLTPDHILRGKYNIGNNELDITDVPANLNSVITLGQGGGGGGTNLKSIKITIKNTGADSKTANIPIPIIDETYGLKKEGSITFPVGETLYGDAVAIYYQDYAEYDVDINAPGMFASSENAVNCTYANTYISITDPDSPASITLILG